MEDIRLARPLLEDLEWNPTMVKKGQVLFKSRERGVAPFSQAVRSMGKSLHNAVVADRVVGLAVGVFCLHARVRFVYAGTVSQGAFDMLKKNGVAIDSKNTVTDISNYDGTDLCRFEKLAGSCRKPSQLFAALQALFTEGAQ